jgi:hypothetical protein
MAEKRADDLGERKVGLLVVYSDDYLADSMAARMVARMGIDSADSMADVKVARTVDKMVDYSDETMVVATDNDSAGHSVGDLDDY